MLRIPETWERFRQGGAPGSPHGTFMAVLPIGGERRRLFVIASVSAGWEHVQVVTPGRRFSPSWTEMKAVREALWDPTDTVVQIHPPADQQVSMRDNALHLWRPQDFDIKLPPRFLVGPFDGWEEDARRYKEEIERCLAAVSRSE